MPQRGRPPGPAPKVWAEAVRTAVCIVDKKTKRRKLELLALKLVREGLAGDMTAIKEIGDRVDGKVPQAVTGGDGSGPIEVLHTIQLIGVRPQ